MPTRARWNSWIYRTKCFNHSMRKQRTDTRVRGASASLIDSRRNDSGADKCATRGAIKTIGGKAKSPLANHQSRSLVNERRTYSVIEKSRWVLPALLAPPRAGRITTNCPNDCTRNTSVKSFTVLDDRIYRLTCNHQLTPRSLRVLLKFSTLMANGIEEIMREEFVALSNLR